MASSVRGGGAETLTVSYQRLTQTLADAMAAKVGACGSSVEQVCVTRVPLPEEGLGPRPAAAQAQGQTGRGHRGGEAETKPGARGWRTTAEAGLGHGLERPGRERPGRERRGRGT